MDRRTKLSKKLISLAELDVLFKGPEKKVELAFWLRDPTVSKGYRYKIGPKTRSLTVNEAYLLNISLKMLESLGVNVSRIQDVKRLRLQIRPDQKIFVSIECMHDVLYTRSAHLRSPYGSGHYSLELSRQLLQILIGMHKEW